MTQVGIYDDIQPEPSGNPLRLPLVFPLYSGYISPYIPPFVIIQIQGCVFFFSKREDTLQIRGNLSMTYRHAYKHTGRTDSCLLSDSKNFMCLQDLEICRLGVRSYLNISKNVQYCLSDTFPAQCTLMSVMSFLHILALPFVNFQFTFMIMMHKVT